MPLLDSGIITAPIAEAIMSTAGLEWDSWIWQLQHLVLRNVPKERFEELFNYFTGLGYEMTWHSRCGADLYELQFTITRDTIADTRRGDAVAFDGRYEVVERREA